MATNKDKLIAGAQKLVEKNQFEKAIKEYLKVVAEDDKDVRIWLKIGDLYAKLGKKSEAAETYSKVAQFYSDQGFYLKAVAVYKQILKIEPRLVDVNQKLAELYKQLGLLSDAMQQYEAVAAFYHREGKTREALAALKQIVELDPETVANRIKLAELYSKEQMAREAIDEFSKAAEQLRQAGRVDEFMKVAERLLFHSPDNRPVTKELAGLYIEKGDPRRALPKLQICFKADPRDTEVLSLLARAFEALDQRQKSVSVLKELARILGENGDNRARDATWRKILQLAPGDPDAEAALSSPGRQRSQPAIETAAPPPPRNATAGSAVAIGRIAPTNATGGRPVQMSASGRVQALRDEPPAPEPNAPKAKTWDGPTVGRGDRQRDSGADNNSKGFEVPDDSMRNAAGAEEEIARILNETDVYIKYNLHAKAIEHLQRAFERNPRHIGAREKLKALFLILGKKDEAVLELWSLVESAEPGRKRRYLREILEIDPTNARASSELGEKLQPSVGALTSSLDDRDNDDYASVQRDPEGTGSEMLDVDDLEELDDDDLAAPPDSSPSLFADAFAEDEAERRGHGQGQAEQAIDRRRGAPIEIEESEDDELIPVVVEQEREPEVASSDDVEDRFGFDHDEEPVEDRFGFDDKEEESTLPPSFAETALSEDEDTDTAAGEPEPEPIPPSPPQRARRESSSSVGREPTRQPLPSLTREPSHAAAREPSRPAARPPKKRSAAEEELDADVHTRFDDQPLKFDHAALFGNHSDEVDEADLPPLTATPLGTGGTRTQQAPKADEFDDDDIASPNNRPVTRTQLTPAGLLDGGESGPVGTTLEDELDEADFFVQQNLFDEARVILENLLSKHPGHPLVSAKLRDLEAMERAVLSAAHDPSEAHETRPGMSAEMDADSPDELPGDVNATATVGDPAAAFEMTRKGVIEKGVTAEDFETHYDLGIAYKEMGLLD
ncbi:MAG TPA: tetratricopeptide repeat protein, partial [Polyangia bacterium]|nr:tetratricopeptide repeat protein [Polyangia bacterium]